MPLPSGLVIDPPLINSANPWATTIEDLTALYNSPYTGAITIRTSLLTGFPDDPSIHQYTFFSPNTLTTSSWPNSHGRGLISPDETSTLNTLGYSPINFVDYWKLLQKASRGEIAGFQPHADKPIIISVTGTPAEILECLQMCDDTRYLHGKTLTLLVEINLSCPNILGKEPPSYDMKSLREYIDVLADFKTERGERTRVGVKFPPFTHAGQFEGVVGVVESSAEEKEGVCGVDFFTCCNTLGNCLLMNGENMPVLNSANGSGIGGMAGSALHPLALGNVATFRRMLDQSHLKEVRKVFIIGVGGVGDQAGFERMRSVGADVVGVGTALGREGVGVFAAILGQEEKVFIKKEKDTV